MFFQVIDFVFFDQACRRLAISQFLSQSRVLTRATKHRVFSQFHITPSVFGLLNRNIFQTSAKSMQVNQNDESLEIPPTVSLRSNLVVSC